jgi:hypothetical protein
MSTLSGHSTHIDLTTYSLPAIITHYDSFCYLTTHTSLLTTLFGTPSTFNIITMKTNINLNVCF